VIISASSTYGYAALGNNVNQATLVSIAGAVLQVPKA
jgi:hypothetical protein